MLYAVLTFFILLTTAVVIARARAVNALTRGTAASVILIPALADDKQLPHRVKAFHAEQMFCDGRYASDIIIVITDPRAAKTAVQLAEELDGVRAVWLGELEQYISDNYKEYNIPDS